MLIQYIVENFMSIEKEVLLNMITEDANVDSNHIRYINAQREVNKGVLRCAAFFGANASGKTNLVKSIDFARSFIVDGIKSSQKIAINQFKLAEKNDEQLSKFQFIIYSDKSVYDYGFQLSKEMVVEEWLYKVNGNGEKPMFERKTDNKGRTDIKIHQALAPQKKTKERLELIKENIGINQKNQLFISKLYENNVSKVVPVVDWFKNLHIIYPGSRYRMLEIKANKDQAFTEYLSDLLNNLDTGIKNVFLDKQTLDLDDNLEDLPDEAKDRFKESIAKMDNKSVLSFELKNRRFIIVKENGEYKLIKLQTGHKTKGDKTIPFETFEESDGTQRLFDLLPALFDMRSNNRVYIIDELDRSLHTLLSKNLIKQFINNTAIGINSQLLFTTHDLNLLDLKLLRKDEIWFVEKNNYGASEIWSLSEYDIDTDLAIQKGYLNGRFGAIPFIREVSEAECNIVGG